ncbi:NAD(P)/FAD-dependent oxidoreductase [Porticoccaceae bacterium]|jgi:all-trans-retinol 13,14-reductase|nr:NAD(P)/FAD-dependent oxidoreductase [Porticoccaceae bacterium]MDB4076916.1 NAD(P)/FAD-dependent oxidoreductase [Porticoccaceae bacterium]MDB4308852.1 NAD(P)/FAD-dependent oxidoreductase [Porticoccaceae bacterium]
MNDQSADTVSSKKPKTSASTLRIGTRYRAERIDGDYDAIVIGSGIGGLCSAALLSQMGKKVIVLEQHYTAGGFTHAYERNGYEWDVGVHYIGDMGRKSQGRGLFDFISGGKLKWAEMDPVYDRIILGDEKFDFVAGKENFKNSLKEQFPDDVDAIDKYVELVTATTKYMGAVSQAKAMPTPVAKLMSLSSKNKFPDYALDTSYDVLRRLTDNEKLIAVLCGQWGDHGCPPKESVFLMHALIAGHYFNGGFYPVGGASQIAATIIPQIQVSGGDVFTYADVQEIIIDKGRAVGVKMVDGHCLYAEHIISNAGVVNTFSELLPAALSKELGYQQKVDALETSMSHGGMYLGLKGTAEELQLPKTNLWIYIDEHHDDNVAALRKDPSAPLPLVYVSFPSAKDPDFQRRYPGRSTIEIVIGPCDFEAYRQWADKTWGKRGDDYEALKENLSERMLEALYKQMPQLRGKVDYSEVSTPLSTSHFCRYKKGEAYGLAHNKARFQQDWLKPKTAVPGLYLTGQDVISCGVVGALMAGMVTAMSVVGIRGAGSLMKKIKAGPVL